ncbi:MAG: DUF922 domain-containing protein [Rhizobiaceae bacterium]
MRALIIGLIFVVFAFQAFAAELTIKEKTSFYRITGKSTAEFARSMSRRGPYSRQHRKRAWATASRDMSYQLTRQKTKKSCRVKAVKVRLKITYKMPKPTTLNGMTRRQRKKWASLYRLLERHERTHGKYYRQFANKVRRELKRIRPTRTCRQLDRKAAAIVEKLGAADSLRNDRFDARDGKTYRRVERIYTSS